MEELLINTAKVVLSGSLEKGVGTETVKSNGFTPVQQVRHDYLFPIYREQTSLLIPLLEGRGKNSWLKVTEKIGIVTQLRNPNQDYFDELYDNFGLDIVYTQQEIIGIVGEARRTCGLPPYTTRIKASCEGDFFGIFVVEDVYEEKELEGKKERVFKGYKPKFKLKPDL